MKKIKFKHYLAFFLIYSTGTFLNNIFYHHMNLVKNIIYTLIIGVLATIVSVWIASKWKRKVKEQ